MVRYTSYHSWGVPEEGDEDYEVTFDTWWDNLDDQVVKKDTLSNRPAAGTSGRWFLATDGPTLYYDNGTSWATIGGRNLDFASLENVSQINFDTGTSNLTIQDQFDSVQMEFLGGGAIDVPGEIRFGDGSTSSPSITFSNDGDTGLYRIGADSLGFVTGGVKAAEFDANQNLNLPDDNAVRLGTNDDFDIRYDSGTTDLRIVGNPTATSPDSRISIPATTNNLVSIDFHNNNLVGVNDLQINDTGGGEGIKWSGQNGGMDISDLSGTNGATEYTRIRPNDVGIALMGDTILPDDTAARFGTNDDFDLWFDGSGTSPADDLVLTSDATSTSPTEVLRIGKGGTTDIVSGPLRLNDNDLNVQSSSQTSGAAGVNNTSFVNFVNQEKGNVPANESTLYFDNSEGLQYYHDGAWRTVLTDYQSMTNGLNARLNSIRLDTQVRLFDDKQIRFGTDADFDVWYDGSGTSPADELVFTADPTSTSPYDLLRIGKDGIYLPNRDLYMEDRHIRRVESVRFSGDGSHDSIFMGSSTPFRIYSGTNSQVVTWFRHDGSVEVPNGTLKPQGGLSVSGGDAVLTQGTTNFVYIGGTSRWQIEVQSDDDLDFTFDPGGTSQAAGPTYHSGGAVTYFNKATYQGNLVAHNGLLARSNSTGSNRYGVKYKSGSDDIMLTNREAGGDTYIAANTGTAGEEADAIRIPSSSSPSVRVLNGLSVNGEDIDRQPSAAIPTSEIPDGDHAEIRVYVPAGSQLKVWMWGCRDDTNSTPSGLTVELYDETNATSVSSSSTAHSTGNPIASVNNGTASMDATLRLNNATGGAINASAVFGYTIEP